MTVAVIDLIACLGERDLFIPLDRISIKGEQIPSVQRGFGTLRPVVVVVLAIRERCHRHDQHHRRHYQRHHNQAQDALHAQNLLFPEQGDRPTPLAYGATLPLGASAAQPPMNDFYCVLQLQVGYKGALDASVAYSLNLLEGNSAKLNFRFTEFYEVG